MRRRAIDTHKPEIVHAKPKPDPNHDRAAKMTLAPPLMQVVTKGWWTLREERASAEALAREDMSHTKP